MSYCLRLSNDVAELIDDMRRHWLDFEGDAGCWRYSFGEGAPPVRLAVLARGLRQQGGAGRLADRRPQPSPGLHLEELPWEARRPVVEARRALLGGLPSAADRPRVR